MRRAALGLVALLVGLGSAGGARAAACGDPGASWGRASPETVGLDPAKLQAAIDFATTRSSESVKVFRHGCLAGEDRFAAYSEDSRYESFSVAKSVVSLAVGRAVTQGRLGVDDPIGGYLPEADVAHGAITVRQLLTMSSGLHWNFFRDYNVSMPDRVADALSLAIDRTPGTWFEYAQSPVALMAKVVERAVGRDFQAFLQDELFTPIGIAPGSWSWTRDRAGNTVGFYGVTMRTADYARLGHLMRNRGRWKGTPLISEAYVEQATTPSAANPGYGFYFWLNEGTSFVAPTIYSRDARNRREIESAPPDLYGMAGFQDQRVYVIPSLDMVIVRWGYSGSRESDTRSTVFTSAPGEFEHEWLRLLMRAVADATVQDPGPYRSEGPAPAIDPHYGMLRSAQEPEDILAGLGPSPY